jgi:Rrf2 family protein
MVLLWERAMSSPIRISEAANLALHATGLMASEKGAPLSAASMAASLGASRAHLTKVLQRLVRAGIVSSIRGPGGGYRLAHPPQDTTLRQIYEAMEGPLVTDRCLLGAPVCGRTCCPLGKLFHRLGDELVEGLTETTLADYGTGNCA